MEIYVEAYRIVLLFAPKRYEAVSERKENAIRHTEKKSSRKWSFQEFFCAVPVFLSECDGGKRSTASTCESGKAEMIVIIERDADTGQCQGTNIRNPADIKCGLQCYSTFTICARQRKGQFEHQFPDFSVPRQAILLGLHEKPPVFVDETYIFSASFSWTLAYYSF